MYKNVGFVRVVKRFFKRFFVHFFSLKKGGGGGGVFHFLDLHNFYVQAQFFFGDYRSRFYSPRAFHRYAT